MRFRLCWRSGLLMMGVALAGSTDPARADGQSSSSGPVERSEPNQRTWLDHTCFNLLVDYYTEVPQRPYGTGFTRENLLPALEAMKPGYVMIYAKGHSGATAFKSRLDTEHPMLGEDPLAVYRAVTREAGVRFVLYYSGLIDGKAAAAHPDWASATPDGKRRTEGGPYRMIPICPSSSYLEEYVAIHLEEMITRYEPDGIWVDGDWGGGGTCHCENCKQNAKAEFGTEDAVNQQLFHVWIRNEFRRKFAEIVHRYDPNCIYSAGNTSPSVDYGLPNYMDWYSGDWFTPMTHRVMQSLSMRRYTTLGPPYEATTCDTQFIKAFPEMRSRVKTVDRMMQEGAGILINGGKWCYWTYPMPNGALIPSRVRMGEQCREFAREREHLWLDTQSVRWTAVVDATPRPLWILGNEPFFGAAKALLESHRSPDLIHIQQLSEPIPYDMLVIANQSELTADQVGMLERYVRGGGKLLTGGMVLGKPGMDKLLGVEIVKGAALFEGHVRLAEGDYAGVYSWWDHVEPVQAEVWYDLYRSWDAENKEIAWLPKNYPITGMVDEENPERAGFPAVVARRVGEGLIVHIAGDPFGEFWKYGHPTTRRWIGQLLNRMQSEPLFQCDAPSWVEVSLRTRQRGADRRELLVHFLNGSSGADLSLVHATDLYVDEIPQIGPIHAELHWPAGRQTDDAGTSPVRPAAIYLEPGRKPLDHEWKDGRLTFTVPSLKIHACVRIEW